MSEEASQRCSQAGRQVEYLQHLFGVAPLGAAYAAEMLPIFASGSARR
jgi:hypothetical protein